MPSTLVVMMDGLAFVVENPTQPCSVAIVA